jgi:hypothetical protein
LAILLLIFGLLWFGTGYVRSLLRHADYGRALHLDSSEMLPTPERQVPGVIITFRDDTGAVQRAEVDPTQLSDFVAARVAELETDRVATVTALREDVRQRLADAFGDGEARIDEFADWYFAWGRSWELLWQMGSSATRHAATASIENLSEAIRRDVTDYFRRHFTEQVLRPEYRDRLVQTAIREAVAEAHQRFVGAVVRQDGKLRRFLAAHTSHLVPPDAARPVRLDWDAQRWKAPTYLIENKGAEGLQSLLTVGGGVWMGSTLGPVFSRLITNAFAPAAARVATGVIARVGATSSGAVLGSSLPGIGTAIGAGIGLAAGFGVDYLFNKGREWVGRESFEAANRDALHAVRDAWAAKAEEEIGRALDVWFDDARAALLNLGG